MFPVDGWLWFGLTLLPLALLQRLLHRQIQAALMILTRSPDATITLFSLLFLPGVLLHELSHYVAALILGVPTARFSLIPRRLPNGRLQLGYVETLKTDILRDSLIGAAPLLVGGALVAYLALTRFHLLPIVQDVFAGRFGASWAAVAGLSRSHNFPLWFYLLFAISSTMLPSTSDRHAWLPLAVVAVSLLALAGLAGAGPWMLAHLATPLNSLLRAAAIVFGVSAILHGALLMPLAVLHYALARITGVDVA